MAGWSPGFGGGFSRGGLIDTLIILAMCLGLAWLIVFVVNWLS